MGGNYVNVQSKTFWIAMLNLIGVAFVQFAPVLDVPETGKAVNGLISSREYQLAIGMLIAITLRAAIKKEAAKP